MATLSSSLSGVPPIARMLIFWACPLCSAIANEPQFPNPPANALPLNNLTIQDIVQDGFALDIEREFTAAVNGASLLTSVEVRCKARWGGSSNFNTIWQPKGGWPKGLNFCYSTITPLEGPNENAGAGWLRQNLRSGTWVKLGCRASGGNIFDQYSSWVRARFDIYVAPNPNSISACGRGGDRIGNYAY